MKTNARLFAGSTLSKGRVTLGAVALTLAAASLVVPSIAQEAERGKDGKRGVDSAQRAEGRQARSAERMQEHLGVSDEEFAALAPMIQGVRQLQREAAMGEDRGGRRGDGAPGRGGRDAGGERGPRGDGSAERRGGKRAQRERSAEAESIHSAMHALRTAIRDAETTPESIQQDIAALRAARAAHAEKLNAAQEELRGAVPAHQEAVLIVSGILN